jgi:hypothetical protein
MHFRTKLASTRKGGLPMEGYFTKTREYADEMTTAGKQLDDDDIVSYILVGLDAYYNGVIEKVSSRTDEVSLSNLSAQLLAAEVRIENQNQVNMSVNAAARGGGFHGRGGHDGGHGSRGGFGRGYGCGRGPLGEKPICQICDKIGHSAENDLIMTSSLRRSLLTMP